MVKEPRRYSIKWYLEQLYYAAEEAMIEHSHHRKRDLSLLRVELLGMRSFTMDLVWKIEHQLGLPMTPTGSSEPSDPRS